MIQLQSRDRTRGDRRRWRRQITTALAVVTLTALAGCGVRAEDRAHVVADNAVPFSLLDPDAAPVLPPVAGADSQPVPLCFISDGHLVTVEEQLGSPVSLVDTVEALSTPPAGQRRLRSAIGDPDIVRSIGLSAGVATVDLGQSIADVGGEDQRFAVAQLVCTLTAQPGVGQVAFTLERAPIGVPRADGSLVTTPVSRDDYQELLA